MGFPKSKIFKDALNLVNEVNSENVVNGMFTLRKNIKLSRKLHFTNGKNNVATPQKYPKRTPSTKRYWH